MVFDIKLFQHVYDDLKSSKPRTSSNSHLLKPESWKVSFAPPPRDIHWQNLQVCKPTTKTLIWVTKASLNLIIIFFHPLAMHRSDPPLLADGVLFIFPLMMLFRSILQFFSDDRLHVSFIGHATAGISKVFTARRSPWISDATQTGIAWTWWLDTVHRTTVCFTKLSYCHAAWCCMI